MIRTSQPCALDMDTKVEGLKCRLVEVDEARPLSQQTTNQFQAQTKAFEANLVYSDGLNIDKTISVFCDDQNNI